MSDIRLLREGLGEAIGRDARFRAVAACSDVVDLDGAADDEADVVVVDATTPGARDIVRALRDLHPTVPVVAFAVGSAPDAVVEWAEVGAAAFVSREATLDEMFETIVAAARGELLCTPRAAAALLARVAALSYRRERETRLGSLTTREQEVARLLVDGLSNKQIAARLTIELPTVKNHVHSILDKLGVPGRRDAASVARAELSRAP